MTKREAKIVERGFIHMLSNILELVDELKKLCSTYNSFFSCETDSSLWLGRFCMQRWESAHGSLASANKCHMHSHCYSLQSAKASPNIKSILAVRLPTGECSILPKINLSLVRPYLGVS